MRIHFIAFWIHFLGVLATPTTILMGYTDYFLFEVPMQDFMLAHTREEGTVAGIDWWWDGCSVAPDRPFGFEFLDSCIRHDFGYRNYTNQGRCREVDRKRIDDNFEKDLFVQCAKEKDDLRRGICEKTALGYYHGVRVFGGARFCNREATI